MITLSSFSAFGRSVALIGCQGTEWHDYLSKPHRGLYAKAQSFTAVQFEWRSPTTKSGVLLWYVYETMLQTWSDKRIFLCQSVCFFSSSTQISSFLLLFLDFLWQIFCIDFIVSLCLAYGVNIVVELFVYLYLFIFFHNTTCQFCSAVYLVLVRLRGYFVSWKFRRFQYLKMKC